MELKGRRVAVTGAGGFLGKSLTPLLSSRGAIVQPVLHSDYELTDRHSVRRMYSDLCPSIVIHCAAACGGIQANIDEPARFLWDNLTMGLNLIEEARLSDSPVEKFVLVSTVCAYPITASIPLKEEEMWQGKPHETIGPYGLSKRMLHEVLSTFKAQYGLKSAVLCFTNMFGPNDHLDEKSNHFMPAVIKRFVDAKREGSQSVTNWGTGKAIRDFLFVEDAAKAIVLATESIEDPAPINIASGGGHSIAQVVEAVQKAVDYQGEVLWDHSKPDGIPKRFCDVSRARKVLHFSPSISLEEGIARTVEWYTSTCK